MYGSLHLCFVCYTFIKEMHIKKTILLFIFILAKFLKFHKTQCS